MQKHNEEIDLKQYSDYVYSYFYNVNVDSWSLCHYIDWICKNERELSRWDACLDNFYTSLNWIHSYREISSRIRAYAERIIANKDVSVKRKYIYIDLSKLSFLQNFI